jgi:hypothetical protein
LYAAGFFGSIGGQLRSRFAAVDTATGLAKPFAPEPNNRVSAIAVVGGKVYAGGDFITIGGQSRARIAALDAITGAATAWNPGANGAVDVLLPVGNQLLAGGLFNTIGGVARTTLATVDTATATVGNWNPDPFGGPVYTLSAIPGQILVCGQFTGVHRLPQANVAEIADGSSTDGVAPPASSGMLQLRAMPNPVRRGVQIRFVLPAASRARVTVLDVEGRLVATPLREAVYAPGEHTVALDVRLLRNGLYLCRLDAAGKRETVRLVVAR